MAIQTRLFVEKGPRDPQLHMFVDPSVNTIERFRTPVCIVEYDDAVVGILETLDDYMSALGYDAISADLAYDVIVRPGDPGTTAGRVKLYALDVDGVTQLFAKAGDGTRTQLTHAPSSITITAANDASVNLSVEGDLDWIYPTQIQPRTSAVSTLHTKISGGWLADSFSWRPNGQTPFSQLMTPFIYTSNVADDLANVALNATTANGFFSGATNVVGVGFVFRVPVTQIARFCRVHMSNFTCDVRVQAFLASDPANTSQTFVAVGSGSRVVTIRAASALPMDTLVVSCFTENPSTPSPNIKCAGITLATV